MKAYQPDRYIVQQLWGCFADVLPLDRYDSIVCDVGVNKRALRYLYPFEVKNIERHIRQKFNDNFEIRKKDTFARFISRTTRQIIKNNNNHSHKLHIL